MGTLVRPQTWLSPVPAPLRGTLLDAAGITNTIPSQATTGLFESYNCLTVDTLAIDPCPASFLAAPVQAAAGTATTGGTLAAGVYKAVITAFNGRGETVASNEISKTTTGTTSTVTWNWAAVTGATGYKVWVTAVDGAAGSETHLVTLGDVATYVWTGTPAADGVTTPPTTNTAVVIVNKEFEAPAWQDGFSFAVYAGVECKAVAFDREHAASELERVFTNKESVAVARALMTTRFADGTGWDAATDLTPAGGAVDPVVGLAILEGNAGSNYGGAPTIHMGRTIASILLNKYAAIEYRGDTLYTLLGSKVAADSGYESPSLGPDGDEADDGEQWMYASGEVSLAATAPVFQSQAMLDINATSDSNQVRLLRERKYIASVDCYTAAVGVKVQ